jgi:hypothetical protein
MLRPADRGNPESVKALPDLRRFRDRLSPSLLIIVRAMNGAFDELSRHSARRRRATTQQLLVRVGAPALAVLGIGAIGAVLIGLQCGGLSQCFAGKAPVAAASAAPAATLPAPVEASLSPAATPAPEAVAPTPAASAVAVSKAPAVPEGVKRAQRVDQMIGNTFVALASDDEGWLRGAVANAVNDPETYAEGDGAGPPVSQDETAVEAADAVAGETTKPLERPTPLDVAAFAEAPAETAASVKAEAERKLAEAAKSAPKSEPEPIAEPEPEPVKEQAAVEPEAKPEPEPAPAKQEAAASGDTRTVAGSGVNVRSGPGKSNGRVFGLAGGEKVTVSENRRGWLKITDDQGRTGWVYKDYLN